MHRPPGKNDSSDSSDSTLSVRDACDAMRDAFMESARDMMHRIDREGNITYANRAMVDSLGYPHEELLGMNIRRIVDESRHEALNHHLELIERNRQIFVPASLWKRKDGRRFHCEVSAVADVGPDGHVYGAFAIARDVTPRKRMEAALRRSKQIQRTVLDQMQEAVVYADENNRIRHINAFACRYLNTTRSAAIGRDLAELHSPAIRPRILEIVQTFRTDSSAQVVTRQRPLGDREMIFRFSAVRDAKGAFRGVIANLIDVTEIKRLETRLQQAEKMESVGRLAGGIAHDFNNLMVTVTGLASLVQRRLGAGHPEADSLREIENAGIRASQLANQLVTYARTGKHRPQRTRLNDVIECVLPLCKAGLPSRVTVETHLDPESPEVHVDPIQIEQVIMNLCLNAAEAGDGQGRVCVSTSTALLQRELADFDPELDGVPLARLTIEDNGCGMDSATLSRAFEPYFTTKKTARGLGLASVDSIVRNHGGHIQIESHPGQGTRVHVFLPIYDAL